MSIGSTWHCDGRYRKKYLKKISSYKRPHTFKLKLGNNKLNNKKKINLIVIRLIFSMTSLIHLVTRTTFILKLDRPFYYCL